MTIFEETEICSLQSHENKWYKKVAQFSNFAIGIPFSIRPSFFWKKLGNQGNMRKFMWHSCLFELVALMVTFRKKSTKKQLSDLVQ